MGRDVIYRQDAIKTLHDEIVRRRIDEDTNDDGALDEFDIDAILRRLPSAERTGEWIRESLTTDCPYKCSACKKYSRARYDFCPNCGADMRSEKKPRKTESEK